MLSKPEAEFKNIPVKQKSHGVANETWHIPARVELA
jgi:hypothetical protein